jgi:hypothetical protein
VRTLKARLTRLGASAAVASLAVGSLALATSAGATVPTAAPHIDPAPRLPRLPVVTGSTVGAKEVPRSVPAAASVATGGWQIWSTGYGRLSGTEIMMPPAAGTPLLGDWNGDGVDTPGRYEAGQWFITNAAVDSPQWEGLTAFGGDPTDIPVVGLIDGDRRADVGVFRNGEWHWHRANGKPSAVDNFGQAGDTPIVGDWDGDGRDDLGVVRGNQWILRLTGVNRKPAYVGKHVDVTMMRDVHAAVLQFSFGAVGDLPVVGDWDRDGRDDPGFVRGRSEWVLGAGLEHVRKSTRETHPLTEGEVPLVGNQATGIGHCPSATRSGERFGAIAAAKVRPPITPPGTTSIPGNAEILATVQDGLRYVMTNDLTKRLKYRVGRPYYDPLSTHRTIEESVRRSANSALAAAIMLTTTKWKTTNGISRRELLDYARWHIRSLACEHGAVTPGGWGNTWQSALWAATVGQAGWLLWDELNGQERAYVAAMVVSEADYATARGPRYFRNRLGQEITPGDSQSDAVSWDLMAPSLALSMMPKYGSAGRWRSSLIGMAIAAFARPGDLHNPQVVNGVQLDVRLPGTNANEDGTVTNHGIVNPDYIQNVEHLWWAASLLRAADRPVPEALFLNADIVYRALAVVDFPAPPYATPGGTVYQPLGQIYYPMGADWGTRRPATFVGVDAFANVYSAPDVRAGEFLAAHAADTRALQMRWSDGHIYADGPSEESYRLGKEEYALQQMSLAWWAGAISDGLRMRLDTTAYKGISLGRGTPIP